jgi:hypothetical protein
MLAAGTSSYAPAMLRFDPLSIVSATGVSRSLNHGDTGSSARWIAALPWIIGYLGPPAWIGGVWLWKRRRALGTWAIPLFSTVAAGVTFGLMLSAPARSQLFFLHYAEMVFLLAAGAALLGRHSLERTWKVALLAISIPFFLAGVARTGVQVKGAFLRHADRNLDQQWLAAADWVRENTPHTALIVSSNPEMLVSVFAERRSLFENPVFIPQSHAAAEGVDPWERLRTLRARLFASPDPESMNEVRSLTSASTIYSWVDRVGQHPGHFEVESVVPPEPLERAPGWKRVFRNEAVILYEWPAAGD